ncbi:hypothetical protein [Streptomyces sp. YIM 132580]|uniref:hypothetical protein n=1 Tax=Streptomyces sp. YIM 132580 TaxID=2691958 RepID=UPI001F30863E|nr:hypothetical protein [Streptomyces sp. YIM 132580]
MELLSSMVDGLSERESATVVQTAAAVGGEAAYELVKQIRGDESLVVANELRTA